MRIALIALLGTSLMACSQSPAPAQNDIAVVAPNENFVDAPADEAYDESCSKGDKWSCDIIADRQADLADENLSSTTLNETH